MFSLHDHEELRLFDMMIWCFRLQNKQTIFFGKKRVYLYVYYKRKDTNGTKIKKKGKKIKVFSFVFEIYHKKYAMNE